MRVGKACFLLRLQARAENSMSIISQMNEVTTVQEDGTAKVEVEIKVAVAGNLLPKGPKKGTRSSSRSISFLAILSDGGFIAYKRIK